MPGALGLQSDADDLRRVGPTQHVAPYSGDGF